MVALELHIAPREVWAMAPTDLATVVSVLEARAKKAR